MKQKRAAVAVIISLFVFCILSFQNCSKGGFKQLVISSTGDATFVEEGKVEPRVVQIATMGNSPKTKFSETALASILDRNYLNFREYKPQYPLYSDGASKRRWIYVPAGQKIDTTDLDNWAYPVGTITLKEFSYDGKKIETRMMEKVLAGNGFDKWKTYTYIWKTDQSDADLLVLSASETSFYLRTMSENSIYQAEVVKDNYRMADPAQCAQCHNRGAKDTVLGFSYLQLSNVDLRVNINTLKSEKLLSNPPENLDEIKADTAEAKAAMGYMQGNCAHCHTGVAAANGSINSAPQRFKHLSGILTQSQEPIMLAIASKPSLLLPGKLAISSIIYEKFAMKKMPKIGITTVNPYGKAAFEKWIASMPPDYSLADGAMGKPVISSFQVSSSVVAPGESVNLTFNVSGATSLKLKSLAIDPSVVSPAASVDIQPFAEVNLTAGQTEYTLNVPSTAPSLTLILEATNDSGQSSVSKALVVSPALSVPTMLTLNAVDYGVGENALLSWKGITGVSSWKARMLNNPKNNFQPDTKYITGAGDITWLKAENYCPDTKSKYEVTFSSVNPMQADVVRTIELPCITSDSTPIISSFSQSDSAEVAVGANVNLNWNVQYAGHINVTATDYMKSIKLPYVSESFYLRKESSLNASFVTSGTKVVTLHATNRMGDTVSQSITVAVADQPACLANEQVRWSKDNSGGYLSPLYCNDTGTKTVTKSVCENPLQVYDSSTKACQ